MYIAFKWLVGLVLIMWIAICWIDTLFIKNKEITSADSSMSSVNFLYKNVSAPILRKRNSHGETYYTERKADRPIFVHYFMFFAGVLAVSIFNRKNEIMQYTKHKVILFNSYVKSKIINTTKKVYLNATAIDISAAIEKYSIMLWEAIKFSTTALENITCSFRAKPIEKPKINLLLLKKLKEIGEEKQNLGRLLIAAIQENKNIRSQYYLEVMAKNRLARYVEDTQKLMKENRSKYISFQHLYLVAQQENIFLKSRLKKLTKEKEDAETKLLGLVKEVYCSKNNDLISYCSRFIVQTKDKLFKSDLNAEIEEFLENTARVVPSTSQSVWKCPKESNIDLSMTQNYSKYISQQSTGVFEADSSLIPLVLDEPKLRGLPGEYVWTVKDKDGIIEKLYEYNYNTNFDSGDTIRRIRQYSVYYDKDCLLDFSSQRSHKNNLNKICETDSKAEYRLTNQRFLTDSVAFKEFLRNNTNIVPSSSSTPSLLCN